MANGIEQEKEALRQELRQMIADGAPREEIVKYRDAKLSEIEGKQAAVQQEGAPVQQGEGISDDSDSSLAPGSSESNIDPFTGKKLDVDPETQKALKDPKDIGAWENFKNNVSNVMTRIYGFDNRLDLVTADIYEKLLGKEAADKMWAAMPAYDPETGEWIESTDELRANAYRELAETQAAQKQTIGLIDAWEEGSPAKIISAAAGAGLNMVSTLITSGLTLGAGLYTDMVGDAIYDANTEKAKANGMTVQELYESGGQEFETPAMVGIAGGMLERLGSKGVANYIGGVSKKLAGEAGKKAATMINNMGKEGMTEWLQTGLETYNREFGKGNEDAPGVALDTMFSREGLEAALQGAIGAGVGGGAGKGARHFVNKAAERAGVLPKGETPTADMAEAADDSDYLFDAKDNETFYKSQVQSVEEARATLEQDFDETTPEQRDEARGVIQEAEAAKRAEETKKRYTRQMVQEFNEEYDGTVEKPTEEGRIAYVARKLGEVEGVDTFDEALAMTKAKNRDALKVVSKAFISARTPKEAQLVDDINENLVNAKKALEAAPPGPTADALSDLVADYNADLANLYATANRKVLFADPVAVADAIEASEEISALNEQQAAIDGAQDLTPQVKGKLLANIEDKRAQALEKGEVARQRIEESSSKNVEGTNTEAKYFDEVLKEEALENTKSTDAIIGEALGLNLFEDPDAQPVIDETLAKNRQPIDVVDGVRHYGKRIGGNFQSRAEALQAGKQTELSAKQKGLKTDITYTDVNPERPGGETTVEIEMYKPREQDLTEAVNALKNQEQEGELAEEGVQEEDRTPTDYVKGFAPEAKETALGDGSIFLPGENAKAAGAFRAVRGLQNRGHKGAKFEQIGGGFLVRPGERDAGPQQEYSIDEGGRAHGPDGKFVAREEAEASVAEDSDVKINERSRKPELVRQFLKDRNRYQEAIKSLPKEDADKLKYEFDDIYWKDSVKIPNTFPNDTPAEVQVEYSKELNKAINDAEFKNFDWSESDALIDKQLDKQADQSKKKERNEAKKLWNWFYNGGLTNRWGIPAGFAALDDTFSSKTSKDTARKVADAGFLREGVLSPSLRKRLTHQLNYGGRLEKRDLNSALDEVWEKAGRPSKGTDAEYSIDESGVANQKSEIDRVKSLPIEAEDGATFNLDGTVYEGGGLVVPIASKNMKASELTNEAIESFKTKYKDYMGEASKVGIYKFPGQDQVSIDLNVIAPSDRRDTALQIGRSLGQESLFDLDTFENVKTGQTGANPKTPTPAQAKNISHRLTVEPRERAAAPLTAKQERKLAEEKVESDLIKERNAILKKKEISEDDFARIQEINAELPSKTTQSADQRRRAQQAIQQGPESDLEPGIILGKDAKDRIAEATDEDLAAAFDRYLNNPDDRRRSLKQDIGPQPEVNDSFLDFYNEGQVTDADFIKAMANYVVSQSPNDKALQGFAIEKFVEQVKKGNFKDKTVPQVFRKAKAIGKTAKTAQREAYGENRDRQRLQNVARRAEQAFYADQGREPGLQELADFISERDNVYKMGQVKPEQIEAARFEERPDSELTGVIGDARDKAQGRAIRDAGLDNFTDIVPASIKSKIDNIADTLISESPVIESEAKFQDLKLRRGASLKRATQGDKAARQVGQRATTLTDSAVKDAMGQIPNSLLRDNWGAISDLLNIDTPFDQLTNNQKIKAKRQFAKGLVLEAENRLGKQTTPSQELDFSIEEGSATRDTDLGVRSKLQVNSHRQPWNETAKELNNTIRKTDFSRDWVQWSPGQLGDISRGRAKGIPMHVLRELNKQPARVAKLVSKHGLETRKDTKNPGVYHIYKPGEIGSKPDFSIEEKRASTTRPTMEYRNAVGNALKKAWGTDRVYDQPSQWNAKVYGLKLSGVQMPFDRVKGIMHANAVYLNPSAMTKDTPIHEFAHIWAKQLMRDNPKLWKRGADLLKGSEYAKAVYEIPTYKAYLKDSPSRFWEEVMANAIGKRGAVLFENRQKANAWDRWMGAMTKWLKNKLGISAEKDYMDLTLDDWLDVGIQGVFSGKVPTIPKANSTSPAGAIEYSVKNKQNEPRILKAIQKKAAEKAAERATKEAPFAKRLSDWFVGPSADDYHGLADRFKRKFKNDEYGKKFDKLTKLYQDNYGKYEIAATKVREEFKEAGDNLSASLGIKSNKLDNYLADDSGISVKGSPISYNQAMAIYSDKDNADIPQSLRDEVSAKLPSEMKKFVDQSPFTIKADETIQQAMLNYINKDLLKQELSGFINYKDQNFDEQQVNALGGRMGKGYADALNDSLARMSGKSGQGTEATTARWADWLQGSVGAIMFLNFRSAALQGLSIWNYMSADNIPGFNSDLASTFKKGSPQQKLFKELWNDPMMKERRARAGFDVNASEITDAMNEGKFGKGVAKLLNKGFVLTSGMDSVAIAAGGAAFINQGLKSGKYKTKEAAKKAWREKTQESQQSARPDRVSKQQKAPVSKFILAFANTPAQYFRLSQKAYRVFKDSSSTTKQKIKAAKDIAYYMAIQNAIFTMAQSASTALFTGWGDDEDERKDAENALNSMTDTWLRGMGLLGAVSSAVKNSAINAYRESKKPNPDIGKGLLKGAVSVSPPLSRKINDLIAIGNTYKYDEGKKGFRNPNVVAGGRALAVGANIPADWMQKKLAAAQLLYEGEADFMEFLQMFGGYSEYAVLGKGKDEFDIGDLDIDLDDIDIDDIEIDF